MLSNRWLQDCIYEQTAENCQVSNFMYTNFPVLFKKIQQKIPTKFVWTVVLLLALENFDCAYDVRILQSFSIGCSLANCLTKDFIAMQICF